MPGSTWRQSSTGASRLSASEVLEVVGAEVGEVPGGLGAGVVDENVDRAVGLLDVADRGCAGWPDR
jgi:hypothetical protein